MMGMNDEDEDIVYHLDASLMATYIDRRASGDETRRVEDHLATCPACRTEWMAVQGLVHRTALPSVRALLPLAAAATVLLLFWPWRAGRDPVHREPAVVTSQAPGVIAPRGVVTSAPAVVWSLVPGADRYRVSVFDSVGRVLWETSTADTILAVPDSVGLTHGAAYFWRVHARTGYDRWIESSLVEFRLGTP
jgi:predicted anti-sigma-YlaC factor YlaD